MGNIKLYENLLDALEQKVPKKAELVNIVTNTLRIEKESAYRRLRGEIPFTLNEAGTMAVHMGLSMDQLIYNEKPGKSGVAYVALPLYSRADVYDHESIDLLLNGFREISSYPDSEHGIASNVLPPIAYLPHRNLSRFMIYKWSHRQGEPMTFLNYSDIVPAEEGQAIQDELFHYYTKIESTVCIVDVDMINDVIRDMRYFFSIRALTPEDIEPICSDITALLDEMHYITQYGKYRGTGNKFDLYLSDISLGTGYHYASGGPEYLSSFTTFVIQMAVSTQKEAFIKIKDWVDYIRRMSTFVTMVSVKERVRFIDRQRRLIDEFLEEIRQEQYA